MTETALHQRLRTEARLPAQYGPVRDARDASDHELVEFTAGGLEMDGWLVNEDGVFNTSKKNLTVDEQADFAAAKQKELQSFFDNAVWTYRQTPLGQWRPASC